MGQLVGEHGLAVMLPQRVGPASEENIGAGGERGRLEALVESICLRTDMHADGAEVSPEGALHASAHRTGQSLAPTLRLVDGRLDLRGDRHTALAPRP